jgi:flavin-dependent dehydrogenase
MPEVQEWDVVVVGGGPGGSMAAREAARAGLQVLMVEKRQEIGAPVRCGWTRWASRRTAAGSPTR